MHYVRPENTLTDDVSQESPEDIPFTKTNKILGHYDQKFGDGYCLRPGKIVGDAAMAPKGQGS